MDKKDLYILYEKMYFYEIEHREKITSRLQLPLAILVSLTTLIGYMIQNINKESNQVSLVLFIFSLVFSSYFIIRGVLHFISSLFGHSYELLPTAKDTEEYFELLQKTYKPYNKGQDLAEGYLFDYLYKYYYECSSKIALVNEKRSKSLHLSNKYIIISIIPIIITFLIFTFSDINKNYKEKIYKIHLENMTEFNNSVNEVANNGNKTTESKPTAAATTATKTSNKRGR